VTVGVVGLGRIGRRYAEQVAPLAGRVVGHDPALAAATGGEPELLELDALLAVSDVVSLHLPLTPDTHHLLDDRRLGLLPRDAVVVNVSRGALVDPVALLAHLDSGHLAAAALDVLTEEPPGLDEPLVRHPRTLVTPHAAYLSPASARDYVLQQAENAIAFLRDGRPVTPVTGPAPALTTGARPDDAPLNDPHQPHLNQDQENPC
jgi:D-3-phosphoglycerate dehydrogenase